MRYTVRTSQVQVIGPIWMPNTTAAMTYTLHAVEISNVRNGYGDITRVSVAAWLDMHAGDFSSVTDFSASIEDGENTVEIPWDDEESEAVFNEATFGSED